MTDFASRSGNGTTKAPVSGGDRPRVLITGACRGVGRACATLFAERGAELVLADNDATSLSQMAIELDAVGRYCDVASEASVTVFAAEIMDRYPALDMVINAAGGGYERTLGMYRVSRALLPALRRGELHNILLNIPPAQEDVGKAIFPYASSQQAFQRLCAALAAETRGSSVKVLIACPHGERLTQVLPDRNAGPVTKDCDLAFAGDQEELGLAAHIAALFDAGSPDNGGQRRDVA